MADSGGARSRNKGRRGENEFVKVCNAYGVDAVRISEAGLPGPDVSAFHAQDVEVKRRAAGFFKFDYANLRDAQILAKRSDYEEWLLTMRLFTYLDSLDDAYDRGRAGEPMWPE